MGPPQISHFDFIGLRPCLDRWAAEETGMRIVSDQLEVFELETVNVLDRGIEFYLWERGCRIGGGSSTGC
jgi:hypothetical protein